MLADVVPQASLTPLISRRFVGDSCLEPRSDFAEFIWLATRVIYTNDFNILLAYNRTIDSVQCGPDDTTK